MSLLGRLLLQFSLALTDLTEGANPASLQGMTPIIDLFDCTKSSTSSKIISLRAASTGIEK
jgi:hypothetical protein